MIRSRRLLSPACAVLAVVIPSAALAGGAQADTSPASAAITLPASSQLIDALDTLVSPSAASTLSTDITKLASSGSTSTVSLLDTALNAVLSTGTITLPAKTATAGASLETTLAALDGLAPNDPSAAQSQSLAELSTAVTGAGLSSLISGLGSSASSAITQLAALQSLTPGASTSAGGLSGVAAIVTTLAGTAGITNTDAATLTTAASTLGASSALTPAQLQSVIGELESVTSSTASATSGVSVAQAANAIATVLSQSGSLFGVLASVGSPLSAATDPTDVSTAVSDLSSLTSLAPGSTLQLTGIAEVLNAIAVTPGVPATDASGLQSLAGGFAAGETSAAAVQSVSTLKAMPALPTQLASLLTQLTTDLSGSEALLGTITGLSGSDQTAALNDLAALAKSGQAQTGELPGLATLLTVLSGQIPSADSTTRQAAGDLATLMEDDSLDADQLYGAAEAVSYIAQTLPSTEVSTVAALATLLSQDAEAMTTTPATTATTTPSAPTSSAQTKPSSTTTTNAHPMTLTRVTRSGETLSVTLACPAGGANCSALLRATAPRTFTAAERVGVRAGHSRTLKLTLIPKRGTHTDRHSAITLVITSGSRRITRSLGYGPADVG